MKKIKKNIISRFSIRRILLISIFFIIITMGSLIILISFLNGEKAISKLASHLMSEIVYRVDQHLSEFSSVTDSINRYNAVAVNEGYLKTNDSNSDRRLWKIFRDMNINFIDAIYYGDESGMFIGIDKQSPGSSPFIGRSDESSGHSMVYYYITPDGRRGEVAAKRSGVYDPRKRPWYISSAGEKKSVWSPIYRDWLTGLYTITLARPVYDVSGNLMGVCGIDVFINSIENFIRDLKISRNNFIFIVEADGSMIVSSEGDPAFIETKISGKDIRLKAENTGNDVIKQTFSEFKISYSNFSSITGVKYIDFQYKGETYFAEMKHFMDGLGLEWYIVTVVPESDFLGGFKKITRLTILISFIILVAAFGLIIYIAGIVTGPLEKLSHSVLRLAEGNLQPVNIGGPLEITILSRSFSQMAEKLQYTIQHLEERVAQRTIELSDSLLKERKFSKFNRFIVKHTMGENLSTQVLKKMKNMIFADHYEMAIYNTASGITSRYNMDADGDVILSYNSEDVGSDVAGKINTICFPLYGSESELGYFLFERKETGAYFSESDRIFAESLCSIIAIALDNERLFRKIKNMATIDGLTGLYNRQHLEAMGLHAFENARRYGYNFSVIMFDIDYFKRVNDSFGHETGDKVLKTISAFFKGYIRKSDIAGRYGGEEFLVLLPSTGLKKASKIAERIRIVIQDSMIDCCGISTGVTVSAGIAEMEIDAGDTLEKIIGRADIALYEAKNSGRNCVKVYGKAS